MVSVDSQVWTEKYRPDTLDEVRGNEHVVDRMKMWVEEDPDDSMPNVLFSGPQGVGKTATVVAFVKEKYGDDWKHHFKQLNASNERGIDVIREEVKSFAQLSTPSSYQWKVLFLDEADALTSDAQPALRRIMEDFSASTRFVMSCNYRNQIIDPLLSRCAVLPFQPLEDDEIYDLLVDIADSESVSYSPDQLEDIVRLVDGDARDAITTLQTVSPKSDDGVRRISDDLLDALVLYPEYEDVEEVVDLCLQGDVEDGMEMIEDMLSRGVDAATLADYFAQVVQTHDALPEDAKVKMLDKVAETEWRVLNGSQAHIQFNALLANLRVAQHLSLEPYSRDHGGAQ